MKTENLKKMFAIITILGMLVMMIWYGFSVVTGIARPTISTWVIFCFAVSFSFLTYRKSKKPSLLDNIANVIDFVFCWSITVVIIFFGKNIRFSLNIIEIFCFISILFIVIFWLKTKSHENANIFLQIIMVIAYFPMFYQLWNATENYEPIFPWIANLTAGLSNIFAAILAKNKLAIIYSARMVIMLSILLFLILRIKSL